MPYLMSAHRLLRGLEDYLIDLFLGSSTRLKVLLHLVFALLQVLLKRLLSLLFFLNDFLFTVFPLRNPFFLQVVSESIVKLFSKSLCRFPIDVIQTLVKLLILMKRDLVKKALLPSNEFRFFRRGLLLEYLLHPLQLFLCMLGVHRCFEIILLVQQVLFHFECLNDV